MAQLRGHLRLNPRHDAWRFCDVGGAEERAAHDGLGRLLKSEIVRWSHLRLVPRRRCGRDECLRFRGYGRFVHCRTCGTAGGRGDGEGLLLPTASRSHLEFPPAADRRSDEHRGGPETRRSFLPRTGRLLWQRTASRFLERCGRLKGGKPVLSGSAGHAGLAAHRWRLARNVGSDVFAKRHSRVPVRFDVAAHRSLRSPEALLQSQTGCQLGAEGSHPCRHSPDTGGVQSCAAEALTAEPRSRYSIVVLNSPSPRSGTRPASETPTLRVSSQDRSECLGPRMFHNATDRSDGWNTVDCRWSSVTRRSWRS